MGAIYHLDFETYSAAPFGRGKDSVSAYKYAEDSTTEILIMAVAKDDEAVKVWSSSKVDFAYQNKEGSNAIALLQEAIETGGKIYAHNAQFEDAIATQLLQKTFGLKPPSVEQWRCTAAMARRAAIPSSLAAVGEFLNIEKAKDKSGGKLIAKFSKPRKPTKNNPSTRIHPQDDPEDFARFVDYCRQDVEAEREVHKRLAAFELKGLVLDSFLFDLRMNKRGVPVNVKALHHVNNLINDYNERVAAEFKEITGLNPTQRDRVHEWMVERGYPFQTLQAASVDTVIDSGGGNMTKEAFKALKLRSNLSYAATKKVPAMLRIACADGFARGCLLWAGAERTHRWAGKFIQPQNFKRSTKASKQAYEMLCEGADIETIEMLFGPFLEVVASCIRHFIHWEEGDLLQADFSSVEARGGPWLCGGKNKLEMFARDEPIYETMASKIFGVPVQQVIDEDSAGDSEKRFIGKQAELGCTYNMGRPKFRATCENYKYRPSKEMVEHFKTRWPKLLAKAKAICEVEEPFEKREIKFPALPFVQFRNKLEKGNFVGRAFDVVAYRKNGTKRTVVDSAKPTPQEWHDLCFDDLANRAVTAWRQDNPEVVSSWKTIDKAAKDALRNPGKVFNGTEKISFGVTDAPGFRALVMKLPSGHILVYPKAKLVWAGGADVEIDLSDDFNTEIQFWGKVPMKSTWGWCKTYGGKLLENATQAICGDFMANGACIAEKAGYSAFMLVHDELIGPKLPGQDFETLCNHLCTLPDWAEGMPLAADGKTMPFYMK
tara:strand:+ start:3258 stop:5576 length:2319 start_codon:yes stop_codon:yes gene_type:complete